MDHRERWAAIVVWGPVAMKLIGRDEWSGWTPPSTSASPSRTAASSSSPKPVCPTLTSLAMGLALRHLPEPWLRMHGCRPQLAETFTYTETLEATCYKAFNWIPRGLIKGFKPTHRADPYRERLASFLPVVYV